MSQDLMQALSGSSLLSLSIGTLPAVKQGMSLDANPFASQLALMTGADAAVPGALAPATDAAMPGEGAFAVALAEVTAPVATDAAPVVPGVADAMIAPPVSVVAPAHASASAPQIVAALPEDASATQIIEAAFAGSALIEAPADAIAAVIANPVPVPARQAAPAVGPVVEASPPHLAAPQAVTPAPAPLTVVLVAQLIARPVAAVDAPMPEQVDLTLSPDLAPVGGQEIETAPADLARPHRRARVDAPVLTADAAAPVAMPLAPVQQPVVRADVPETDIGTTRIAAQAALQAPRQTGVADPAALPAQAAITPALAPDATAPLAEPGLAAAPQPAHKLRAARLAGEEVSTENLAAPVALPVDVAAIPAAPATAAQADTDMPVTPPMRRATLPSETALANLAKPAAAPVMPAPIQAAPASAQPILDPVSSGSGASAAPATRQDDAAPAPINTTAAPAVQVDPVAPLMAETSAVPRQGQATPSPITPGAEAATARQPDPQPVVQPGTQPAAEQVAQAFVQPAQTPSGARPAATAPRGIVSPTARRAIDVAVQSPRPAEALSALFDRADIDIDPSAPIARTDFGAASGLEPVPPLWAAALNAVSAPSQAIPGITVPLTSEAAAAAPLESLAFDAGFVANIETQIARVANGGQMVRMQIMPENLGRIDIEMLAGPERDQIRIVTEHDAVRDTLVSSQHRLEQDLRSNAQRPAEVTVELRQQSPGMQNGSAQQQQQQRSQTGAETMTGRDGAQRQQTADTGTEANLPPRRPRGNVRYA